MMTDEELKIDAATPENLKYSCAFDKGTCLQVDELADLKRCERCDKRVCDVHAKERVNYSLCVDCDRDEKTKMESLIPHVDKLVDRLRNYEIGADEFQMTLVALVDQASTIEGFPCA